MEDLTKKGTFSLKLQLHSAASIHAYELIDIKFNALKKIVATLFVNLDEYIKLKFL